MVATKDRWKRIPFTNGRPIPFQGTFSREEFDKLREGLIPEVMEDKWFIYFEAPYLFLHRSWTGHPAYRVTLTENGDGACADEALCIAELVQETGAEHQAKLLDFLISNLLLTKAKPFPVPAGARKPEIGLHQARGSRYGLCPSVPRGIWDAP